MTKEQQTRDIQIARRVIYECCGALQGASDERVAQMGIRHGGIAKQAGNVILTLLKSV